MRSPTRPRSTLPAVLLAPPAVVAFVLAFGCGSSGSADGCTPGQAEACACLGGPSGVQTCRQDHTFDTCRCGEPTGSNGDGGPTGTNGDGGAEPAGPQFLSFGTSSADLTEGGSVTISAVLTDPDGIDDLIGGSLKSADGTRDFGAFATAAQEGAYSFVLTWKQLDDAIALTFVGDKPLAFVAEFFDAGGHKASRGLTIRLHCTLGAACGGRCVSLKDDPANCGSCATVCPTTFHGAPRCQSGQCAFESGCTPVNPTKRTCAQVCAAAGGTCDPTYVANTACEISACVGYTCYDANETNWLGDLCQSTAPSNKPYLKCVCLK